MWEGFPAFTRINMTANWRSLLFFNPVLSCSLLRRKGLDLFDFLRTRKSGVGGASCLPRPGLETCICYVWAEETMLLSPCPKSGCSPPLPPHPFWADLAQQMGQCAWAHICGNSVHPTCASWLLPLCIINLLTWRCRFIRSVAGSLDTGTLDI